MLKLYRLEARLSHFDPNDTGGFNSKDEILDSSERMERELHKLLINCLPPGRKDAQLFKGFSPNN